MAEIGGIHIPLTGRPATTITVDPAVLTASIEAIMNSPEFQGGAYGKVLQGETARAIVEHIVTDPAQKLRFNEPVTLPLPDATNFGLYNPLGALDRPLADVLVDYGAQYIGPTELYNDLLEIPAGGARTVKADIAGRIQDRANGLLTAAREARRELTPANALASAAAVEVQRAELQAQRRSAIAYAMSMAEYAGRANASRVNVGNLLMFEELLPPTARVALQFYRTSPGANMDRILQNVNVFYATMQAANIPRPDAELAGLREFTQFMQGYVMEEMSGLNTAPAGAPPVTPLQNWAYTTNRDNPVINTYTPVALRGQAYASAGFNPIEAWMFHRVGPRI